MPANNLLSIYSDRAISKKVWGRALGGSAVILSIGIAKTIRPRDAKSSADLVVAFSALGDQLKMMSALSQFEGIPTPAFATSDGAEELPRVYFDDVDVRSFAWHGARSTTTALASWSRRACRYRRALVPFPFVTQPIALSFALSQAQQVVAVEPQERVDYAGEINRVERVRIGRKPWNAYYQHFFQTCYPSASLRSSPQLRIGLEYRGLDSKRAALHVTSAAAEKTLPINHVLAMLHHLEERGLDVVVLGSARQRQSVEAFCQGTLATPACGLPLLRVAELLANSRLFVGVDSSMMNLADAIGVPSVIVYGPTEPGVVGPFYAKRIEVQPEHRSFVINAESTVGNPSDRSIARIDVSQLLESIDAMLSAGVSNAGAFGRSRALPMI